MSLRAVFIGAVAAAGSTPAMADVPSKALMGVSHAVITCEADSSLSAEQVQTICAQLVSKAQAVTRLPVKAIHATELAASPPTDGERLVLRVRLSADALKEDRGTLFVRVTPSRGYLHLDQGTPVDSQAQLVRLAGKLVVQGPISAFSQILGAAPAKLHTPIRSDL